MLSYDIVHLLVIVLLDISSYAYTFFRTTLPLACIR